MFLKIDSYKPVILQLKMEYQGNVQRQNKSIKMLKINFFMAEGTSIFRVIKHVPVLNQYYAQVTPLLLSDFASSFYNPQRSPKLYLKQ